MHRGLPTLKEDDYLGPWMYRVARSAIVDHLRSRRRHPLTRRPSADLEPAPPAADDDATPFAEDGDAVAREVATYLSFFVALLPSPYREAITLTELEGRTQKEAAEMVGVSLSAMKSRVQRGREKLREMLEACCEVAVDVRGKVIACVPRPPEQVPAGCCG
jgi:RNA polymerase sigma-70 factor (ECF subfamily)